MEDIARTGRGPGLSLIRIVLKERDPFGFISTTVPF